MHKDKRDYDLSKFFLDDGLAVQMPPSYEEILRRVESDLTGDRNTWLNDTARMFDQYPFCLAAERIVERKDGQKVLVLVLVPAEKPGKRISVSSALDLAIENHDGLTFFQLDGTHIWSLSHGEVLGWRLYREPFPNHLQAKKDQPASRSSLNAGETIFAAAPNSKLLPPLVRNSLRWFMKDKLKMKQPKIAAIATSRNPQDYRLLFSFGPASLGSEAAAAKAFQQVHWYLPPGTPTFFIPKLENAEFMGPI